MATSSGLGGVGSLAGFTTLNSVGLIGVMTPLFVRSSMMPTAILSLTFKASFNFFLLTAPSFLTATPLSTASIAASLDLDTSCSNSFCSFNSSFSSAVSFLSAVAGLSLRLALLYASMPRTDSISDNGAGLSMSG